MKKLYKQLNELKLEPEVEPMDVSDIEKARIRRAIMQQKKKKQMPRVIGAAAAFLLAAGIATGAAFPAYAAKLPLVGNLFGLFQEDASFVFNDFEAHTTDIGATQESNGIRITVENAVYDGENITIAYTMESDTDLGDRPVLDGLLDVPEFGDAYQDYGFSKKFMTEKISETEYAGLLVYQLIQGPKPEELTVTWNGDTVLNLAQTANAHKGDWSFTFPVKRLDGKTVDFTSSGLTAADNGIALTLEKSVETPVSRTLYLAETVDIPEVTHGETDWRGVLLTYEVSDNLGNHYNTIHYQDVGHSSDFDGRGVTGKPRIMLPHIDDEATSLIVTPIVNVYEKSAVDGDFADLELAEEPYAIESIEVPLKK